MPVQSCWPSVRLVEVEGPWRAELPRADDPHTSSGESTCMAGIQFSPDPSHRVGCAGTWALQRCTPSAAKFRESVGLGARLGRSLGRSGLLRLRGVFVTQGLWLQLLFPLTSGCTWRLQVIGFQWVQLQAEFSLPSHRAKAKVLRSLYIRRPSGPGLALTRGSDELQLCLSHQLRCDLSV